MSPATPRHDVSDSEDDADYVPPTGVESSSSSEDEGQANEQTVESSPPTVQDLENQRRERDALWTSFQASVVSSSNPELKEVEQTKMIKIQKRYLFAGEYTTEIIEVPEDSPDAKKWPLYESQDTGSNSEQSKIASFGPLGPADHSSLPNSLPKKPGPRKPKKTLAALPSTSDQKAKKLTTLDKSLMDWKTHTEGSALRDELEANRKAGGYLEKVEFLKRVDERKEENLESLQSRKRRKL